MKILRCNSGNELDETTMSAVAIAAEDIAAGRLVVYPTETVYGVGADVFNQKAVKKVFMAKNRPFDMPLSVAVTDKKMMEQVAILNENADRLIDAFLPGPLTIIIKKNTQISDMVTAGSEKVGVRIPDNPIALELVRRCGPIVATSANTHSHPDSVVVDSAVKDLGDKVATYLDSGECTLGKPSTIVWLYKGEVEIVRQGAISKDQIEEALRC
ncbi:MAG: L-threonylcarbamoyladenylate synthase [Candidatus Methanomethylophilaceae archaeon]|nr:L-threonylcarbamoyladenylate synthase [Candidatus Methanomethylophilaceae archaeon]